MKALIAAAGYGTRLFPATKSVPKSMLPLNNKPLLQHIVEELAALDIRHVGILCRDSQQCIRDHFRTPTSIHTHLSGSAAADVLHAAESIDNLADLTFLSCDDCRTLADALLAARPYLRDEPFVLALGDEVCLASNSPIRHLMQVHATVNCTTVACRDSGQPYQISKEIWDDLVVRVNEHRGVRLTFDNCMQVPRGMLIGRYLLDGEFLSALAEASIHAPPDFYTAMDVLARRHRLVAVPFDGCWWHCGEPLQYVRAALDHITRDPAVLRAAANHLEKACADIALRSPPH
jgi:UTP--glucose-1-phosphate uridylyltransferase